MFISRWLGQKSPSHGLTQGLTQGFTKCLNLRFRSLFAQSKQRPAKTSLAGEAGFTLIEIMVVIAIIGILATLIVPKIMGRPDEARATAARHDVGTIVQSLKLYRLDVGRYPTTEQGIKALVERPTAEPVPQNWKAGGYLDSLPKDPWGMEYKYRYPAQKAKKAYDVWSVGKDGADGTEDDIGNWPANTK